MKNLKFKVSKTLLWSLATILMVGCGDTSSGDGEGVKEGTNSSDFLSGVDGWKIEGDAKGSTGVIPNFSEMHGVGNTGYIYAKDDATGGVWYFVAPSKYHGDKSSFFNGKLEFYLIQDSVMVNQFYAQDLIVVGASGEQIVYNHNAYPEKTWTKYEINLNTDSQWLDKNKNIATNEQIKRVLSSVTKVMIRGEFEDGQDTGGLDGFKFIK